MKKDTINKIVLTLDILLTVFMFIAGIIFQLSTLALLFLFLDIIVLVFYKGNE